MSKKIPFLEMFAALRQWTEFVNAMSGWKIVEAAIDRATRSAVVAAFIIVLSMTISLVGLSNIIKYGYGYCGYFAIAVVIVPFLTVGVYKNRKYLKEHPQAQGRSYEEAVQARQAAEPEEETTPAPAGQFEKEGC